MSNNEHQWIEDRLDPGVAPEPPAGLLEKIQEEIPHHLEVVPAPSEEPSSPWRLRVVAASVVVVVLSGAVVYRIVRESPTALEQRLSKPVAVEDRVPVEAPPASSVDEVVSPSPAEPESRDDVSAAGVEERAEVAREVGERQPVEEEVVGAVEVVSDETSPESFAAGVAAKSETVPAEAPTFEDSVGRGLREDRRAQAESQEGSDRRRRARETVVIEERLAQMSESVPERKMRQAPEDFTSGIRVEVPQPAPSTGGTAEPNDAAWGDMFFRSYGTNPFIDTEDDSQSTFGLDVDTGSFTLARSYLEGGNLPPSEAIRVEEFVNFFDYRDPAPRRGEFTLIAEGAPSPFANGPRYQLIRFGIKAREIDAERRPPASLIFVVDVSGSMARQNRLDLVRQSLHLLLDQLNRDDRIGLVVYGSRGEVLLEPTTRKDAIRRAIDRLVPGGSTNAEEGLELAYGLARRHYREGDINRIILCSDGVANVGRTGPESILERVRREADEGIELTTLGFGMGNYNDVLMEQLADQGDGSYAYIDTLDEARRIFVERLTGTLQTVASDAKVQVEFNPQTVSRYRLIGYENRDIADERFRDDSVDAGEIGAGHAVTALYEIKLHEGVGRRQNLATLRLRYRSKATDRVIETSIDLDRKNLSESWRASTPALQLSSLAAEFAEILKGSYWAKDSDLDELHRRLRPVADELAGDPSVEELLRLVERARRLWPESMHYRED